MKLLPSQKNALYDAVIKQGLSPLMFGFVELESMFYCQSNPHYNFTISKSQHPSFAFEVVCIPGEFSYESKYQCSGWHDVLNYFGDWVKWVQREITAEDKWGRLEEMAGQVDFEAYQDADKFTAQEYIRLERSIQELKVSVQGMALLPEQITSINSSLEHLYKQGATLGKKDWQSLFIGAIIGQIIQLGLTQQNAHELWAAIKHAFNEVLLIAM